MSIRIKPSKLSLITSLNLLEYTVHKIKNILKYFPSILFNGNLTETLVSYKGKLCTTLIRKNKGFRFHRRYR